MPKISQVAFDLAEIPRPRYFPYRAYRHVRGWETMTATGTELVLEPGSIIRSSENLNYAYLILSGVMSSLVQRTDGSLSQTAFFLEGSMFLEPSALSHLPSNLIYKALASTTLVRIEHNNLKYAMMHDENALDFVIRSITLKLNSSHEQLFETTNFEVRGRIYFMLLGLAQDTGTQDAQGWIRLGIKLTQQEMGDMLGINRVTINTALQDLYDAGVVKKETGFYLVRDTQGFTKTMK